MHCVTISKHVSCHYDQPQLPFYISTPLLLRLLLWGKSISLCHSLRLYVIAHFDVAPNWIVKHTDLIMKFALSDNFAEWTGSTEPSTGEIINCQLPAPVLAILRIDNWIYADAERNTHSLSLRVYWLSPLNREKLTDSQISFKLLIRDSEIRQRRICNNSNC